MKNRKAALAILRLAAAISFALPAAAQDTGFYGGLSLGQSQAKDTCDDVAAGVSCDDKDTAWRVLGGYQFNRHFALEVGYTDLGEVSARAGAVNIGVESSALELVGVASWPLAQGFSAYGKVGLYRGETDLSSNVGVSANESNDDLTFGFGLRYDLNKSVGVRAEWQRYGDVGGGDIGGESDVDVISLGVIFKF